MLSFQTERHFIMQVVCEATQCPDTRVSSVTQYEKMKLAALSWALQVFTPSIFHVCFRFVWRPYRTW